MDSLAQRPGPKKSSQAGLGLHYLARKAVRAGLGILFFMILGGAFKLQAGLTHVEVTRSVVRAGLGLAV